MNKLAIRVLASILLTVGASGSRANAQGFPAYETITGTPFQQGLSSTMLGETPVPDLYELMVFVPSQVNPTIQGIWQVIGVVVVDEVIPLQEASHFASTGAIQDANGTLLQASVDANLSAFSGKVILGDDSAFYVSGLLAQSLVVIDTTTSSCPVLLYALPFAIHADLPMASAAAVAMAANASGSVDGANKDAGGVDQGCFDAAHGWDECYECYLQCARDADYRRNVCRAACSYFNWGAIGVGAGGGALAGGACGVAIFSIPAGVVGGIGGAIGAAIIAHAACLTTCDSICDAEKENCMDALVGCVMAH